MLGTIVISSATSWIVLYFILGDEPLMISNLISFFVSYRLQRQPNYDALARQDGVHLPTAEDRAICGHMRVSKVMQPASEVLPPDAASPRLYPDDPLSAALERMGEAGVDVLPVVSRADGRKVLGMITLQDVL